MYYFDTHYGQSSLTDDETGIIVEWENGDFNGTQKVRTDPSTFAVLIPQHQDLASFIAGKLREMGDYIAKTYPELV